MIRIPYLVVIVVALAACGCGSEHAPTSSFAHGGAFRGQLAISNVQSFLYFEPNTQTKMPQVRGSLRNLSNQTLVMVELTLSFRNSRNQIIFEETAYPIYVSALSLAQTSKALAPGQQVKFAFKSPACPSDWQPGHVDVRVTKIAATGS